MKSTVYFLIIINLFFVACRDNADEDKTLSPNELKEKLIKANRIMAEKESEEIDSYIRRHDLKVKQTGTGLRYEIKNTGSEIIPAANDTVQISYRMNLLDGTLITDDGIEEWRFVMGRAQAPQGLEEGLSMIGEGGEIYLIIPSHLAYGRMAAEVNVPGSTPVVVHTILNEVKKHN